MTDSARNVPKNEYHAVSDIQDIYRLAPLQAGLLFQTLYEPGSQVYISQSRYVLTGRLDVSVLRRIFHDAVQRHAILRTAIVWENLPEPVQVVLTHAELEWQEFDWSDRTTEHRDADIDELCRRSRQRGFNLECPPLMRVQLIRVSEECAELIWTWHHILLDGWSVSELVSELLAAYDALTQDVEVTFQTRRPYRDYIGWLQSRDDRSAQAYWTGQLRGVLSSTPCPVSRAGSGEFTSRLFHLTEMETRRLGHESRQKHLTLNTLAQAAWALILSRSSHRQDVVFGGVVSGRPAGLAGAEKMLGLFINTLPIRVSIPPDLSIAEWLAGIQNEQANAREFDYVPLSQLQQWSQMPPNCPLFESILAFENFPAPPQRRGAAPRAAVRVDRKEAVSYTNYPLTVSIGPSRTLEARISFRRSGGGADHDVRLLGAQMLALLTTIQQDTSRPVRVLSAVLDRVIADDLEQERTRIMSARARVVGRHHQDANDPVERTRNR